jgi:ribosomal protein S8
MKLYNIIAILNNEYGINASIPYSKENLNLIKLLYKEGYFNTYSINMEKMKIYIEFNYFEGKKIYNGIKIYYKMGDYYNINRIQLQKIQKKRKKKLLLSTSYGICTSNQAIKYGIGGKIIGEFK